MLSTSDPQVAAEALARGRLVALPTETVYGLGADARNPEAVARVYSVKGRPADHPLIVHVLDLEAARAWSAGFADYAVALAEAYWPGPLTLVVPRAAHVGDFVTGGHDTVAVRVPGHPLMRDVIRRLAAVQADHHAGVAAPSANRFGRVSPTSADACVHELSDVADSQDVVLDGGPSSVGVESTIVDCTGPLPVILRPGKITADDVRIATGMKLGDRSSTPAPGTLAAHYAPSATVHLIDADQLPASGERAGLLALADVPTPPGFVRLSAPTTADHFATVLYRALREADALNLSDVYAIAPVGDGIAVAIRDRLTRAAHGSS